VKVRIKETIVFDDVIEVRSRPAWIVILEFWFVWWDEIFFCKLDIERWMRDDPYWGKPLSAAWHTLHTWLVNHDERIESSVKR